MTRTLRLALTLVTAGAAVAGGLGLPASAAAPSDGRAVPTEAGGVAPVTVQLRDDGPRRLQRHLDVDVVAPPGGLLVLEVPADADLRGGSMIAQRGADHLTSVALAPHSPGRYAARLPTDWSGDVDVLVQDVTGPAHGSYAFDLTVAPGAPAAAPVDLDGPGSRSMTYTAAGTAEQVRGGQVRLLLPPGYTLHDTRWHEALFGGDTNARAGSGDGFATDGVAGSTTAQIVLPTTYGDGHPVVGRAVLQHSLHLGTAPDGTDVTFVTAVRTRPAGPEASPVVAVIGTDRALWVTRPGGGYRSLGGALVGSAAVVRLADARALYVGQGTDGRLWVRTDDLGWKRFGPEGTACSEPDVRRHPRATDVVVACRAADGSLLLGRATVPAHGLPVLAAVQRAGGAMVGGPGLALDPQTGAATVLVVGPTRHATGNVWEYREEAGPGRFARRSISCAGPPTVSWLAGSAVSTVACRGARGDLVVTGAYQPWNGGGAWTDRSESYGGAVVGRPVVLPAWSGAGARFVVVGTNGGVYESLSCCLDSRWRRVSGAAAPGSGLGAAGVLRYEDFPCSPSGCLDPDR